MTTNIKNTIKFNKKDQPEFSKELIKRVNQYFKSKQLSKQGNFNMKFKTLFMISLYLLPLFALLSGAIVSVGPMLIMWILMGLGMTGIGLSVMHDANHGSYSTNPKVNKVISYVSNLVGGYHANWRIQHNVLHHAYTNVYGHDEDIDKGIMRFTPDQERKSAFRFQAFYAPLLYGLMTLYWLTVKDFQQLMRYHRRDLLRTQGLTFNSALFQIIFNKIWYVLLTLVLPLVLLPIVWWQVLLGFLLMHFICGLCLALIFQPAHVVGETEFYVADAEGSIDNHWAIHQMKTTSNFANGNRLFTWLVGGLNFQIEHHLFPNICHVHYRHISSIVKQTAKEFGIPYHQHKTFFDALKSHFTLLDQLGTGKYDRLAQSTTA